MITAQMLNQRELMAVMQMQVQAQLNQQNRGEQEAFRRDQAAMESAVATGGPVLDREQKKGLRQ